MGSFPSVLEEPTHLHSTGGESNRALGSQTPPSVQTRSHTLIIKKLTRGKIILLGIDGAGKSTFARQLIRIASGDRFSNTNSSVCATAGNNDSEPTAYYPDPTTHQVTWSYRVECDRYLQLVDLPGRRETRGKWYAGLTGEVTSSTGNNAGSSVGVAVGGNANHLNVLPVAAVVFVVDSSDRMRFPTVAAELARFQTHRDRSSTLTRVPFLVLFNKTDKYLPLRLTQEQQQGQSAWKASQQQYQAQLRAVRAELRKRVDYELRMLQRRHPDASIGLKPTAPRAMSPHQLASSPVTARETMAALGIASKTLISTCTVMNSVMECCAQNPESVGAVHAWIKDELKKMQ